MSDTRNYLNYLYFAKKKMEESEREMVHPFIMQKDQYPTSV